MPADPRLLIGDAEHAAAAADWLDAALSYTDTDQLDELERLTTAAGELYGTALRDQLRRAIAIVGDNLLDARNAIHQARRDRDEHLTRLCDAVDGWAADYRRLEEGRDHAMQALHNITVELETTRRKLAAHETQPQPATPPAMPEANLGAARTFELLNELLARFDHVPQDPAGALVSALRDVADELDVDTLSYRTIDS